MSYCSILLHTSSQDPQKDPHWAKTVPSVPLYKCKGWREPAWCSTNSTDYRCPRCWNNFSLQILSFYHFQRQPSTQVVVAADICVFLLRLGKLADKGRLSSHGNRGRDLMCGRGGICPCQPGTLTVIMCLCASTGRETTAQQIKAWVWMGM